MAKQPSRRFITLAPWWALYLGALFLVAALTALTAWMAQQRLRLRDALPLALSVGAWAGALGLTWRRRVWRRGNHVPAASDHARARTHVERRVRRGIRGLALLGGALLALGLAGALRRHD